MLEIKNINIAFDRELIKFGTFKANYGYVVGICGRSGVGKSSLLDIVSLLNADADVDYWLDGLNISNLSNKEKESIMKRRITYLRQNCLFINTLTCLDNIILDAKLCGNDISINKALDLLDKVGLRNKAKVYPKKLSGGEEQRLAIAMAMGRDTDIIICDEITSMLDEENTMKIMSILTDLAHKKNKIIIISSHESTVLSLTDYLYSIENKEIKLIKKPTSDVSPVNFVGIQ